jgi:hypothetical protein
MLVYQRVTPHEISIGWDPKPTFSLSFAGVSAGGASGMAALSQGGARPCSVHGLGDVGRKRFATEMMGKFDEFCMCLSYKARIL